MNSIMTRTDNRRRWMFTNKCVSSTQWVCFYHYRKGGKKYQWIIVQQTLHFRLIQVTFLITRGVDDKVYEIESARLEHIEAQDFNNNLVMNNRRGSKLAVFHVVTVANFSILSRSLICAVQFIHTLPLRWHYHKIYQIMGAANLLLQRVKDV